MRVLMIAYNTDMSRGGIHGDSSRLARLGGRQLPGRSLRPLRNGELANYQ
jgi:hypothetical protein